MEFLFLYTLDTTEDVAVNYTVRITKFDGGNNIWLVKISENDTGETTISEFEASDEFAACATAAGIVLMQAEDGSELLEIKRL